MDQATLDSRAADSAVCAVLLSALIQHAPPAATVQALDLIRPRLDDRDWARLMAAIAPLPV